MTAAPENHDDDPEGRELAADEPADEGFGKYLCLMHCIRRLRGRARHCVRGKYYQFSDTPPASHFKERA